MSRHSRVKSPIHCQDQVGYKRQFTQRAGFDQQAVDVGHRSHGRATRFRELEIRSVVVASA